MSRLHCTCLGSYPILVSDLYQMSAHQLLYLISILLIQRSSSLDEGVARAIGPLGPHVDLMLLFIDKKLGSLS